MPSRLAPKKRRHFSSASFLLSALISTLLLLSLSVPASAAATEEEPTVKVEFEVQLTDDSTDTFTVEVHPSWAPLGAARFLELVDEGDRTGEAFWKGLRFFRVIDGFMAQFGIPGNPALAAEWREKTLIDDEVTRSNKRGFLSFATSGKDSRTTQMFVNLVDNSRLDDMGFSPFAEVIDGGMDNVVDKIYAGYGEGAPSGKGPSQGRIQSEGNEYLEESFPLLSYVKSVRILDDDGDGDVDIGKAAPYSGAMALLPFSQLFSSLFAVAVAVHCNM